MTQYRIDTILSHSSVITKQYWVTQELLQYNTESFQLLSCDTESFHGYYNTVLNHPEMTQYRIVINKEWLSIVM
jgi:hypothetical protein